MTGDAWVNHLNRDPQDYVVAPEQPWLDGYGGDAQAVAGAKKFKRIASVAQVAEEKGPTPLPDNETIDETHTIKLGDHGARQFREGASAGFLDS